MSFGKFLWKLIAWIFTVFLQAISAFILIFVLSIIFANANVANRTGWLATLAGVAAGYTTGIWASGIGLLHIRKTQSTAPIVLRLFFTAAGTLLPLLIIVIIGWSGYTPARMDTAAQQRIINFWQPLLAQVALATGLIGFYLPGWMKTKPSKHP